MNAAEFNALPLLLRQREVPGLGRWDLRALREEGRVATVATTEGAGRSYYYVRASVATVLRVPMDWREFEGWPEFIGWWHLRRAGLQKRDIARLVEAGVLEVYASTKGTRRFYKACLGRLVGYQAEH
jgi:hypothetical protein